MLGLTAFYLSVSSLCVGEYDRQNMKNTVLSYSPNPITRTLGLHLVAKPEQL